MTLDPIVRLVACAVQATPRTQWIFFEITAASGLTGVGEASLNGREVAVLARAADIASRAFAVPADLPEPDGLVDAACVSALDQALWDIAGKRAGRTVADVLGGSVRSSIPLYANINRRTRDRTPEGFARSARDAIAAGYTAVKIAPFDEVVAGESRPAAIDPGLARIAAVRAAIGRSCELLVDCHWRLTEPQAEAVIRAAADQSVYWVECPLPETEDNLPALKRLRGLANAREVRLAGCEQEIGQAGFAPFLKAGAYDAMMPDVKYAGGLAEVLRLAELFTAHGVAFSPHNPTGPVCHVASLHVCAVVPSLYRLEVQFDETPLFSAFVSDALPRATNSTSAIPGAPGLGVALAPVIVRERAIGDPLVMERHHGGGLQVPI